MGYPYYICYKNNTLAFTTDLGIAVYTLWMLKINKIIKQNIYLFIINNL